MYPFSFAEVMQISSVRTEELNEKKSLLSSSELFKIYLTRGGFPFLYQHSLSELIMESDNRFTAIISGTLIKFLKILFTWNFYAADMMLLSEK